MVSGDKLAEISESVTCERKLELDPSVIWPPWLVA